jgi:hypothetical protein
MQIETFQATCENCGNTFSAPQLPNMHYGTFLYYAIDGQTVRYYTGIDEPVGQFINSCVDDNAHNFKNGSRGAITRKIIGHIANRSEQDVHFTTDIICPTCTSIVRTVDVAEKMGKLEIKSLQFEHFKHMPHYQKEELLSSVFKKIQAQ